eukprot:3167580-Lingulodinium_polyedra.AAC.2
MALASSSRRAWSSMRGLRTGATPTTMRAWKSSGCLYRHPCEWQGSPGASQLSASSGPSC